MNIIDQIIDFFVRLVRGQLDTVQMRAKAKAMAVQTKVKTQAAKQVNQAINGTVNKAKQTVLPGKSPPSKS